MWAVLLGLHFDNRVLLWSSFFDRRLPRLVASSAVDSASTAKGPSLAIFLMDRMSKAASLHRLTLDSTLTPAPTTSCSSASRNLSQTSKTGTPHLAVILPPQRRGWLHTQALGHLEAATVNQTSICASLCKVPVFLLFYVRDTWGDGQGLDPPILPDCGCCGPRSTTAEVHPDNRAVASLRDWP